MEILHYSIDLEKLFNTQDQHRKVLNQEKIDLLKFRENNKKELLKVVLPFMHSLYALHNNKYLKDWDSPSGKRGLLGPCKVDIQKGLDRIVSKGLGWKDDNQMYEQKISNVDIKIWLNSRPGCYKSTPNLTYSMCSTIDKSQIYAESYESELLKIARECAKYTDEW